MAKKFSVLLAAAAVLAFAVPAVASATSPLVTVGGKAAPEKTKITGESLNTVTTTSIGNLTCGKVHIEGTITKNEGTTVAVAGSGAGTTTTCFFKGTIPITIDDATLISLHSNTPFEGTASLTFEATLPNSLTCHYSGTAVPFTYKTGSSSLALKGGLTAKPPACGTATIHGEYSLSSPGGAVVLH